MAPVAELSTTNTYWFIRCVGAPPVSPQAAMVPSSLTEMNRDGTLVSIAPVRLMPLTLKSTLLPLNTCPVGLDGDIVVAGVGVGGGSEVPPAVGGSIAMLTGGPEGEPGMPRTDSASCPKGVEIESPT